MLKHQYILAYSILLAEYTASFTNNPTSGVYTYAAWNTPAMIPRAMNNMLVRNVRLKQTK